MIGIPTASIHTPVVVIASHRDSTRVAIRWGYTREAGGRASRACSNTTGSRTAVGPPHGPTRSDASIGSDGNAPRRRTTVPPTHFTSGDRSTIWSNRRAARRRSTIRSTDPAACRDSSVGSDCRTTRRAGTASTLDTTNSADSAIGPDAHRATRGISLRTGHSDTSGLASTWTFGRALVHIEIVTPGALNAAQTAQPIV